MQFTEFKTEILNGFTSKVLSVPAILDEICK